MPTPWGLRVLSEHPELLIVRWDFSEELYHEQKQEWGLSVVVRKARSASTSGFSLRGFCGPPGGALSQHGCESLPGPVLLVSEWGCRDEAHREMRIYFPSLAFGLFPGTDGGRGRKGWGEGEKWTGGVFVPLLIDHLPAYLCRAHPCVHSTGLTRQCAVFFQGKKKKRKREKLQESTSGRPHVAFQPVLMLLTNTFKVVFVFLCTHCFILRL